MQRYDPLEAPKPEEWLGLDERERIDLARDYHRSARIRLPNAGRRNAPALYGATVDGRRPRPA